MKNTKRVVLCHILGTLAVMSLEPASAATLTYGLDTEFSGARAPGGVVPWVIAEFNDFNVTGSVRLSVSASGLAAGENISSLYFNLDPALNLSQLTFTYLGSSTAPAAMSIDRSTDTYKADGDGKYDIKMSFTTGGGFDAGEALYYEITGINSLTAASFMFMSAPAGGKGPFYAAAHVQNTTGAGTGSSGWIAPTEALFTPVPLPAAVWLLGSSLLMLAAPMVKGRNKRL